MSDGSGFVPTLDQFLAALPAPWRGSHAQAAYPALCGAAVQAEVDTAWRWSHWISQTAHESMGYMRMREIWGPTPTQLRYSVGAEVVPAGQTTLAQRLGNLLPGEGERYKGRGFIQITGKFNYKMAGDALGVDLVGMPELAEQLPGAAQAAAWFWKYRKCNDFGNLADPTAAVTAVTKRVNGGTLGLSERLELFSAALKAFGP